MTRGDASLFVFVGFLIILTGFMQSWNSALYILMPAANNRSSLDWSEAGPRYREMILDAGTYGGRGTGSGRIPGALVEDFNFNL